MTYWLVAESPTEETRDNPERALTPDDTGIPNLANRLLNLTGWTIGEFLSVFSNRRTVWKRPRPLWIDEGRKSAALISEAAKGADGVVVMGHMAVAAFGLEGESPFEWIGKYASIPNPYPAMIGRYWNIQGMREKARGFFSGILEQHRSSQAAESAKKPRKRPCGPR